MTRDELKTIEARAKAATPGPWKTWDSADPSVIQICSDEIEVAVVYTDGGLDRAQASDDSEFLAHAREDVPSLVAEVRRLEDALSGETERQFSLHARIDRLRAALETVIDIDTCTHGPQDAREHMVACAQKALEADQ